MHPWPRAGTPCQKVRSRRRAGGPSCQAARHPSSVPRACLLPVTQPSDRPAASLPRPVQASAWESLRSGAQLRHRAEPWGNQTKESFFRVLSIALSTGAPPPRGHKNQRLSSAAQLLPRRPSFHAERRAERSGSALPLPGGFPPAAPRPPLASPSALKKSSRVPQKPADFGNIIRKSSASGIICRFQLGSVNARLAACGAWSDGQHHPYSLPLSRAGSTGCPGGASKVSCEGRLRRLPDLAGFSHLPRMEVW